MIDTKQILELMKIIVHYCTKHLNKLLNNILFSNVCLLQILLIFFKVFTKHSYVWHINFQAVRNNVMHLRMHGLESRLCKNLITKTIAVINCKHLNDKLCIIIYFIINIHRLILMNDLVTDVWKDQQVNKDQPVKWKHNIDTGEGNNSKHT